MMDLVVTFAPSLYFCKCMIYSCEQWLLMELRKGLSRMPRTEYKVRLGYVFENRFKLYVF